MQIFADENDCKNGGVSPQRPEDISLLSFTYKQFIKKGENLFDLRDRLINHCFIEKKTSFRVFKRFFSGKEVLSPLRWTGNDSEFFYFVYLIYTKHKLVKDLKRHQWEVACRCFVKADGTQFDPTKLKKLKKTQKTAGIIEKAVELLNNG